MVLIVVFIVGLGWLIARGINTGMLADKARQVKPQVEMTVPVKFEPDYSESVVYYPDYVQERQEAELTTGKVQFIRLEMISGESKTDLHLN